MVSKFKILNNINYIKSIIIIKKFYIIFLKKWGFIIWKIGCKIFISSMLGWFGFTMGLVVFAPSLLEDSFWKELFISKDSFIKDTKEVNTMFSELDKSLLIESVINLPPVVSFWKSILPFGVYAGSITVIAKAAGVAVTPKFSEFGPMLSMQTPDWLILAGLGVGSIYVLWYGLSWWAKKIWGDDVLKLPPALLEPLSDADREKVDHCILVVNILRSKST